LRCGAGRRQPPSGMADVVDLSLVRRGALARAADAPGARAGAVSGAASELEVRVVRKIHDDLTLDLTIRLDREVGVLFGPVGAGEDSVPAADPGPGRASRGFDPAGRCGPLRLGPGDRRAPPPPSGRDDLPGRPALPPPERRGQHPLRPEPGGPGRARGPAR